MSAFRTPEMAFVAAAAAWPRDDADRAAMATHATQVSDWDRVLRLARVHQVIALVADAASAAAEVEPSLIPAETRVALTAEARSLLALALLQAHETARLAAMLATQGVAASALKGAATAMAAFGKQGLRHATDIDLLVAEDDVPRALAALTGEGYAINGDLAEAKRRGHKDVVLRHPLRGITLELHWRLFQNIRLMPVPNTRVIVDVLPGSPVTTLSPLDEALYLAAHGGEHGWARLKWLADLTALLRRGAVDATTLYETARKRGLARMVGPGLVLAHRIHGTPLPSRLARDCARSWRLRRLIALSWQCLCGAEDGRELTERNGATTAKNLSHYLFSTDPRALWYELRFDLLDRPEGQRLPARAAMLAMRLLHRAPPTRTAP